VCIYVIPVCVVCVCVSVQTVHCGLRLLCSTRSGGVSPVEPRTQTHSSSGRTATAVCLFSDCHHAHNNIAIVFFCPQQSASRRRGPAQTQSQHRVRSMLTPAAASLAKPRDDYGLGCVRTLEEFAARARIDLVSEFVYTKAGTKVNATRSPTMGQTTCVANTYFGDGLVINNGLYTVKMASSVIEDMFRASSSGASGYPQTPLKLGSTLGTPQSATRRRSDSNVASMLASLKVPNSPKPVDQQNQQHEAANPTETAVDADDGSTFRPSSGRDDGICAPATVVPTSSQSVPARLAPATASTSAVDIQGQNQRPLPSLDANKKLEALELVRQFMNR
jgi:hypothetical protein